MKDINESGYSSSKAASPEQVENHLSHEKNNEEILAEALSEIDSTSPISIKEGELPHLSDLIAILFSEFNPIYLFSFR